MSTNDINEKQNQPDSIALLKAADAAYRHARRADLVRYAITIASVPAAILASFYTQIADAMAVAGGLGVVTNELIRNLLTLRWSSSGMLFQEWLDTDLFGLTWNASVGNKPRHEDSRYWEKRFRGDASKKRDWYIDVRGLPRGHAILLCQRENLSWDARLRRIWGAALLIFASAWPIVGLIIGSVFGWTVGQLVVRWLVPSAPALVFAIETGLQHRTVATEKEEMINRIEDLLGAVAVGSTSGSRHLAMRARAFQDQIARLRSDESRVPYWLYRRLHGEYEDEASVAAQKWRDKLVGELRSSDGSAVDEK